MINPARDEKFITKQPQGAEGKQHAQATGHCAWVISETRSPSEGNGQYICIYEIRSSLTSAISNDERKPWPCTRYNCEEGTIVAVKPNILPTSKSCQS
jgi:hypothetical protein